MPEWLGDKVQEELEQQTEFEKPSLPLSRIKKRMKHATQLRMKGEVVPLMAKSADMFVQHLAACVTPAENNVKKVERQDIIAAVEAVPAFELCALHLFS